MKKQEFKIGDLATITKKAAECIVSDDGQDGYFPPSGILNEYQEQQHTTNTLLALLTLIDEAPVGLIVGNDFENTDCHNYEVFFNLGDQPFYTRLAPKDLRRATWK